MGLFHANHSLSNADCANRETIEQIRDSVDLPAYIEQITGARLVGRKWLKATGVKAGGLIVIRRRNGRPDLFKWESRNASGNTLAFIALMLFGHTSVRGKDFAAVLDHARAFAGGATPSLVRLPTVSKQVQPTKTTPWKLVTTYTYQDYDEQPLFYVDRFSRHEYYDRLDKWVPDKRFLQRPHGKPPGSSMAGVPLVLYELPTIAYAMEKDATIWITEGEKDADTFNAYAREEFGWPDRATTNPMGTGGGWKPEYSESLRAANVVLWLDDDDAGRRYTQKVYAALNGIAASIRAIDWDAIHELHKHLKGEELMDAIRESMRQ